MANTLTISQSYSLNGRTYTNAATVTADGLLSKIVTAAAAKTGTLTTRTSDSEGELTMAVSHGITTGARLDLYWTGGSRRGITVGTVSVNQVPLTTATGTGDVLPADETAITAAVPVEESFAITGNDMTVLLCYGDQRASVSLCGADDAEDYGLEVGSSSNTGRSFLWYAEDPNAPANPISGDTVTKVFISCGSSSSSAEVRVEALFS
jgi:hypothetical protein